MTGYRFLSPIGLFSVLHGIEAQIVAGEWDTATEDARNLGDEARQQKSGDARNASLWREFILHVDCLNISIRVKDGTGCVGELATLHSALATCGTRAQGVTDWPAFTGKALMGWIRFGGAMRILLCGSG